MKVYLIICGTMVVIGIIANIVGYVLEKKYKEKMNVLSKNKNN